MNVLPELEENKLATDEHTKPLKDRYNLYSTELFTFAEIRQAAQKDSTLQQIKAYVSTKHEPDVKEIETLTREGASYAHILGRLSIHGGLLYHQSRGKDGSTNEKRICLPSELQEKAFRGGHIQDTLKHYKVTPTISRIRWTFYFPNIYAYVAEKTLQCITCNPKGAGTLKVARKADSLGVKPGKRIEGVTHFGQQVYIETITQAQFPQKFRGLECHCILIIQDNWSKYIQAIPIPKGDTKTLTQTLVESWVYVYGYPETLYSYRGLAHISELFFELLSALDIYRDVTRCTHQGETEW